MLRRVGLAYLLAPLAALLVLWVSANVLAVIGEPSPRPAGVAGFTLALVLLVGAPVAYLVAGIAGLPLVYWLQRRDQLRLIPLLALGAATGVIGLGGFWAWIWSMRLPEWPVAALGAMAGSMAALVFWIIAVRQSPSRPAA